MNDKGMQAPASPSIQATSTYGKNVVLTEAGKSPWYDANGTPREAYIVGVAGGSASGKTSVARAILKQLRNVPWVAIVSQDSFYKSLTKAQSKLAFENNYDFDHPDAFDYEILYECIEDLKRAQAVEIPVYSFVEHQRTAEKKYMYGASVVILEGIFVLHDPAIRSLLDLKIFVQCDSDLMLARRIKRDMIERGRDLHGILDQYLRFVKPSMDNFVSHTSKFADIIVPGQNNQVAIEVICQQIRRQLELRDDVRLRHALSRTPATPRREIGSPFDTALNSAGGGNGSVWHPAGAYVPSLATSGSQDQHKLLTLPLSAHESSHPLENELPPNVHVLKQTPQLQALLTKMHDLSVLGEDFVFTIDRLSTLVMEESMAFLPYRPKSIQIHKSGQTHTGTELAVKDICSVAILRSGTVLESSARRVLPALARGTILIQSQADGEVRLYTIDLPSFLQNRKRAQDAWVMVLDSQIGTGAAALMCVRVLLDHGVKEEHILFCCLLASVKGGVHAMQKAFPRVKIIVAGVDPDLKRRIVWIDDRPKNRSKSSNRAAANMPKIQLDAYDPTQRAMADVVAYNEENSSGDEEDERSRKALQRPSQLTSQAERSPSLNSSSSRRSRVCFAICPGAGNIGDRYFGTTARPTLAMDAS
ncbi:hypothetical protein L7F22_019070 [Adiantum nelumboides]|nr:hypothetical protein [Adiantum nelumboides]